MSSTCARISSACKREQLHGHCNEASHLLEEVFHEVASLNNNYFVSLRGRLQNVKRGVGGKAQFNSAHLPQGGKSIARHAFNAWALLPK